MTGPATDTDRPLFSLVLATLHRTDELARFVDSLNAQDARVELIVIDQNKDDRLVPVLARLSGSIVLKHIRSEPGLSKARNVGLRHVTGSIVAFPDDDCWYPEGVLQFVEATFRGREDIDGLTGRSTDGSGAESAGNFSMSAGGVDITNVWSRGISFTIFLRAPAVRMAGLFDETLGVGAGTRFGSGEETDFLISAVKAGARIWYDPRLVVHHPDPVATYDEKARRRGYSYGVGMGRVLAKHRYPLRQRLRSIVRPLGGSVIAVLTLRFAKAAYHWNVARGRMEGMCARP
jgi:glycosyltransferase involved in cell wall biosynthesis